MQVWDYLKALLTGFAVLALNLATLVAIVFGYSFIEPGHPPEFYSEAAPRLGPTQAPSLARSLCFWSSGYSAHANPNATPTPSPPPRSSATPPSTSPSA